MLQIRFDRAELASPYEIGDYFFDGCYMFPIQPLTMHFEDRYYRGLAIGPVMMLHRSMIYLN